MSLQLTVQSGELRLRAISYTHARTEGCEKKKMAPLRCGPRQIFMKVRRETREKKRETIEEEITLSKILLSCGADFHGAVRIYDVNSCEG